MTWTTPIRTPRAAPSNTARDTSFLVVDGLIRGVLAAIAVVDQTKDPDAENMLGDVIVGWDSAALDVDAPARPTAADVLSGRMVSAALRHDGNEVSEQLRLTSMYLPRRLGTPSRPHQLFLALGGSFTLDEVLNPDDTDNATWRFRVNIRSDAGAALLISGDGVEANAEAGNTSVSVGWAGVPGETGISYALPHDTGTRLELGEVGFVITLSGTGARVLFRLDQSALVVDSEDKDGFIRKLLGGRPYKKTFSLGLGYDAELGFIHEVHTPSKDSTAQPAFDSSGPAGPPDLESTLPLGGGSTLGINVHEVVLRVAWRSTDAEPNSGWAVVARRADLVQHSGRAGVRAGRRARPAGQRRHHDTAEGPEPRRHQRLGRRDAPDRHRPRPADRPGQRRRRHPVRPGHRRLRRRADAAGRQADHHHLSRPRVHEGPRRQPAHLLHPDRHGGAPRPDRRLRHLRRVRAAVRVRSHPERRRGARRAALRAAASTSCSRPTR